MRPLREQVKSGDPITARQARLLARVRPLPLTETRKARVLEAVRRRRRAAPAARLRSGAIVVFLLGLATVAGATVGRRWIERHSPPPPVVLAGAAAMNDAQARPHAQPLTPPALPAPLPPSRAVPATVVVSPGFGEQVVTDAAEALHRDRDPARAAMLLRYYLARHPRGASHEDALALAIEAAAVVDPAAVAALAARYLARYPTGRFRERVCGLRDDIGGSHSGD